jgi:CDP-paratose 2-epimerase
MPSSKRYLITGGAGFVGSNLAHALLQRGEELAIVDNLSRKGTEKNLAWLKETHGEKGFEFLQTDIRDADACVKACAGRDVIYHLAGQVAVTTSVTDPRTDFDINALGTLNVLEGARANGRNPILGFASTNKVYGGMEEVDVRLEGDRYDYVGLPGGVSEEQPLDFHSPYGCSKGVADQYVRDYSRIYDLPTFVFRMSCQYGPRQFGNEDQGWVAHFVIATEKGHGLNIYGDGKQVRDVLYIEDLCRAWLAAADKIDVVRGRIYNIGGGRENVLSLLELIEHLQELQGREIPVTYGDWRPGDQKVYISNVARAKKELGWEPKISKREGVEKLLQWVRANPRLFGQ